MWPVMLVLHASFSQPLYKTNDNLSLIHVPLHAGITPAG